MGTWLLEALGYAWTVFSFWAVWQFYDFLLGKLKIRLKKPWKLEDDEQ